MAEESASSSEKPLISVIVPAYNCANTIGRLLEALLQNSYKNIEVLVGDNASLDSTAQEIAKYKDHPRVRVFSSTYNRGAGALRNWLIREAKGEYIALQDADDLFREDRFNKQIEAFEQNSVDVVGTGARLVNLCGERWGSIIPLERPTVMSWWLQRSMVHASVMIRRSAIKYAQYAEKSSVGEDYYFLTQLYLQGAVFMNIPEEIYFYYIERERLKKWSWQRFLKVLGAKFQIAQLFPVGPRYFFFFVNVVITTASYLRQKINR
ncbi:MAG TPA: glycosyltransferase family 2 protein [Bdellovibrio sp.]|uniref:glycosyltransferase family 2 protein n=1 Tax=Bdellovibrio sp. TaxID=28201 RepID=UPI002EFF317A